MQFISLRFQMMTSPLIKLLLVIDGDLNYDGIVRIWNWTPPPLMIPQTSEGYFLMIHHVKDTFYQSDYVYSPSSVMDITLNCMGLFELTHADCGTTPITPTFGRTRIVGGNIAKPYSWPWQVELCVQGWFKCELACGGSVINKNWVLTAAHCVHKDVDNPSIFRLKAGVFRKESINEPGEQVVRIAKIYVHPKYNHANVTNDVALLALASPLKFSNHVQPVCLPSSDSEIPTGTSVTVTGWGDLYDSAITTPSQLRQVSVNIKDNATCAEEYADVNAYIFPKIMICAGADGKDSCHSDSGGPLVKKHSNGRWYQHGIVSWGVECAEKGFPGIYSRVSAFCDFIKLASGVSCMLIANIFREIREEKNPRDSCTNY